MVTGVLIYTERKRAGKTGCLPVNTAHFKEWLSTILSVTETDTLLQPIDVCN